MLVIVFDSCLRSRPASLLNRVRIIKTQKSLSIAIMQRQRIPQAMRTFGGGRNPFDCKSRPASVFRIHDEVLSIQQ